MLYVSSKQAEYYAVTDTSDNTTEYITVLQLKQLVAKDVNVYGVKLKDNKLQVSIYSDLKAIVNKYNTKFIAVGKKPQFGVYVFSGFGSNPYIATSGLLMSAKGGDNCPNVVGKVKIPDFIEGYSPKLFRDEAYVNFSDAEYASLILSRNFRRLSSEMFQRSIIRGGLVLPGSLEEIGRDCFNRCLIEGDLYISDGVEKIGYMAFLGCHITGNLYLPASIVDIESYAFDSCEVDGKVLFSTPPKERRDVNIRWWVWSNFKCAGYGEGVKEFFEIDK